MTLHEAPELEASPGPIVLAPTHQAQGPGWQPPLTFSCCLEKHPSGHHLPTRIGKRRRDGLSTASSDAPSAFDLTGWDEVGSEPQEPCQQAFTPGRKGDHQSRCSPGSRSAHLGNFLGETVTGVLSADKMCQGNPPSACRKQSSFLTELR